MPWTSPERRRAYARDRRRLLQQAGLCIDDCKKPATRGGTRCARCSKRRRAWALEYARDRRRLLKQAGLCINCKDPATRGLRCARCADIYSARALAFQRARRAANLCVQCGAAADGDGWRCLDHRDDANARAWLRRHGQGRAVSS